MKSTVISATMGELRMKTEPLEAKEFYAQPVEKPQQSQRKQP